MSKEKARMGSMAAKYLGRALGLTLIISVLLSFNINLAFSDEQKKLPPDVRVVIDVSGSMKQNDPNNLRRPALDLLLQLLPKDSKAGVWTFGQWVNMLVPHKPVTGQWRKEAGKLAKEINSVALYTNIGLALEKSAYDFNELKGEYRPSVILLTDGVVDISKSPAENNAERERILRDVLPLYLKAGVTIHTIALSHNADKQLLEQLAIDTGGIAAIAENADELMKIFLRAFDDAAPAEQVPLEGNKFLVDSSIEEFTALVFRKSSGQQTELISPDKSRYRVDKKDADIRWYQSADYDLITVNRPLEGEWEIVADSDPDNRVTVVSDLSLDVARLSKNLFLGNLPGLDANLSENKSVIQRPEFLSLIDFSVEVLSVAGGKRWKKSLSEAGAPEDGIYHASLSMLKQVGQYEVYIHVDGKTFQRSNKQLITVRESFELSVEEQLGGDPAQLISLYSRMNNIDQQNTSVLARIKIPSGRTLIKPIPVAGDREWQLAYAELDEKGTYQVAVEIEGKYLDGSRFIMKPEPLTFQYDFGSEPVMAKPKTEPVAEKVAEETVVAEKPEVTTPQKVEEQVSEEPVEEEPEEPGISNIILYGGLLLGNLLIIAIGYLAYRMVTGGGKSEVLDDDSEDANSEISVEEGGDDSAGDGGDSSDDIDPMAEMEQLMGGSDDEASEEAADDGMDFMDDIIEIAPDENDK